MSTPAVVGIVLHEVRIRERSLVHAQSEVSSSLFSWPPPNVPPHMVPLCVLVGACLSEPHIYCVYRSLCMCVHSDGMASVNQNADVLAITFMLYAMQNTQGSPCRSLPHAVWIYSVFRDNALFV